MSNKDFILDETLRAILVTAMREDVDGSVAAGIINRQHYGEPEPLIDKIKDAFAKDEARKWAEVEHTGTYIKLMDEIRTNPRLSGRQWYERFVDEFPRAGLLPEFQAIRPQVLEAARRASVIE